MSLYRGYNTIDNPTPKTRIEDQELIIRDLINHFHISRGEKLMNINFGTIIWSVLFDPLTDELKDAIVEDVSRIINYDPRLINNSVLVTESRHGILIEARLSFKDTNQSMILRMQFDRDSQKLSFDY